MREKTEKDAGIFYEGNPETQTIEASGDAIVIAGAIGELARSFRKLARSITKLAEAQAGETYDQDDQLPNEL